MVNVIGMGYIGLPTALMMASKGIEVVGTDCNEWLINKLNAGFTTFTEEGLDQLFNAAVKSGIRFSEDYQIADTYIISVPTPYEKNSDMIDLSYVIDAVKSVLKMARKDVTIIIESTVSPGSIEDEIKPVIKEFSFNTDTETEIHLAHAPERIIPGNMIYELINNNRTIGVEDEQTGEKVKRLYASFCRGEIIVTDIRTAEMTKVVENTFRAVNIAFANELARICRKEGMDVHKIIDICNKHPRVNILQPGPGVGGHCITVDPWFLVSNYPLLSNIIHESLKTNDSQPEYVLNRIIEICKKNGIKNTERIGLYGLTYKENVDDIRESPTLKLLEIAKNRQIEGLNVYDPYVKNDVVPDQYHDLNAFLDDIDFAVIMVKHNEIIENSHKLKGKFVLDCHNVIKTDEVYHL